VSTITSADGTTIAYERTLAAAAVGAGITKLALFEPPFMTYVGVPAPVVAGIRSTPGWATLEAIVPTLAYDDELLGEGSSGGAARG
jgi:hypothetical protein